MSTDLPSGWHYESLGECCTLVSGATPRRNIPEYWDNHIPWVTPKDISNLDGPVLEDAPEYISEAGYKSCSATLLPRGSVLFSSRAPIGLVALVGREMCTNQGFKSLIPGKNVYSEYLYHCMKWMAPKIANLGNGATFKEVSKVVVGRVQIPLPPLAEQKRIAAILDKADAIRRKRQAAIKLADDFLRATFLDMFGDPMMNPNGWGINTLVNVCEKITDGTHHSPPITQTGIPYVTAKHLKKWGLDFYAKPWFVSEKDHKAIYKRCDPKYGDVLYIKDGATTGIAAINKYDFEFSMLSSLALIRPKKGLLTSTFLCDWLNNERTKAKLLGGVAGAAITRFTINKIKDFRIELPPIGLQKEYSQIRKKVMSSLSNKKRATALADMAFNSLTQRAFRGEL